MKFFILLRTIEYGYNPDEGFDPCTCYIVRAKDEQEARELCS